MRTHVTWMLTLTLMASPGLTYGVETLPAKAEQLQLTNVELTAAGSLEGQVLTASGTAIANSKVVARSQADPNKIGQQLVTDENGRFLVTGLKSGTCIVESNGETYAVRVWTKGTAPPKSLRNVALVQESDETVRGNRLTNNRIVNRIRCMSAGQKVCLGLLVAAAIVIPIALDDDDGS